MRLAWTTAKVEIGSGRNEPAALSHMDLDAYYSHVRAAYDAIASQYDETVGRYAVSRRAKTLALDIISKLTPPKGRLLDIGCYTGIEALLLARRGFNVVGVDLSSEMINAAREKAKKWHVESRARFEVAKASDLSSLMEGTPEPFDTAYSVYGTLNLEPRIGHFKRSLVPLLKQDGVFVCGLLNPTVLYELVIAPLMIKFHGYKKLKKNRVRTRIGAGKQTVETFLYTPREFEGLMRPEFSLLDSRGLHFFYPPPRGSGGHGLWWVARAADMVERPLESSFPFSNLGFFSLLVFKRCRVDFAPGYGRQSR